MKVFVVIIMLTCTYASPVQEQSSLLSNSRIINGVDVEPAGKYPWQGSLELYGEHYCGCVYLGGNLVLSAAHCTAQDYIEDFGVRLGLHHRTDFSQGQPEYFTITEIIEHEDYIDDILSPNDICILKLSGTPSEDNEYIKPIELADGSSDFVGSDCVITGWGEDNSGTMPLILQEADMDAISNEECQDRIPPASILESHICIYNGYATVCSGDSGGPLVCMNGSGDYQLAGLSSWSDYTGGYCSINHVAVFTRVSYFIDWINDNS